jgi:hypothetical protein
MLKTHSLKKIFSLTLALVMMMLCTIPTVPVTYAYDGTQPMVLFEEDFELGYAEDERISQNTDKVVSDSTDPDKWSKAVDRFNDDGGEGTNTGSIKAIADPDETSGHGMVMAIYGRAPKSSTATPYLHKYFNFNNAATALDIRFALKIDAYTYADMATNVTDLQFSLCMPGYKTSNNLFMAIKGQTIYITKTGTNSDLTALTLPEGIDLTEWNDFRVRLFTTSRDPVNGEPNTAFTGGTLFLNDTKIDSIANNARATDGGTVPAPALVIRGSFPVGTTNQFFYLDNFSITEAPVFSMDFENAAAADGDKISTDTNLFGGSGLQTRFRDNQLNFLIERANSEENWATGVLATVNGNRVLKFEAGPGVVDGSGNPGTAEPVVGVQLPMPLSSAGGPATYVIKFSVYLGEGVYGPRIRIADSKTSSVPSTRDVIFAIDNGNTIKVGDFVSENGIKKQAAVEKDENGWSHYILTLDITDKDNLTADLVQNGMLIFEDVPVKHNFIATSGVKDAVAFSVWFSGGPLSSNQYMYYDNLSIEGGYNYAAYGINGVYAWDGTAPVGDALSSLTSGNFVGKTSVKNNSYGIRSITLITALYSDGKLETIDRKTINLPAYATSYTDYISDPIEGSAGKTMKVFLWDDMGNILPLNMAGGTTQ